MKDEREGVILLNMGGPDSLDDVRPFLYNLFSDREIIRLGPAFLQPFLAWLIARRRAPKSQGIYAQIGGGSPLKEITRAQAEALEKALAMDGPFAVRMGMRYWPPYPGEAIDELLALDCQRLTLLPLYPHYSRATSGSSLAHCKAQLAERGLSLPLRVISSWPAQEQYVAALAEGILATRASFSEGEVEIVYSAHSLPVSFIEEGDPYVDHLKETIAAVEKHTQQPGHLCYQSRSGPVTWLSPSTPEFLAELAQRGCKQLVMVPLSFVSDHVETLCEINIEYRELARSLGMELRPSPSLNCTPLFIDGLRRLVLRPWDDYS